MVVCKVFATAFLFLLIGDFCSTFLYHVPEHIFGKFHSIVHHSHNRSFIRYAITRRKPLALMTGFLSAFFYILFIPVLGFISPFGMLIGLTVALIHVEWRHLPEQHWQTPVWIKKICRVLCITTPERHWQHHRNSRVAYGDIFTFYDQPAQAWFKLLVRFKKKLKARYSYSATRGH